MSLSELIQWASDKTRFEPLAAYIEFAERSLDFKDSGLQAVIISQNESNYRFYQYKDDAHFNITRPNMRTEPILHDHIKTIDYLLCEDLWQLLDG